jgi:hypothetical protein
MPHPPPPSAGRRAPLAVARRMPALAARRPPALVARRSWRGDAGQATVELVALLPVVLALLAAIWQAVLAGNAFWAAGAAARAAARAPAVGGDPADAARAHLPPDLERGLRVVAEADGDVRISIRVPALPGLPSPGRTGARAHFEPQS